MTEGQNFALEQLREIAKYSEGLFEIAGASEKGTNLIVDLSLYCGDLQIVDAGLPLREREKFTVVVPSDFPFAHPSVWTKHTRFAGHPHVQWKRHLCLYQAPGIEWDASDGMFGFVDRLHSWLHDGALGQLDPDNQALHPPVAYWTRGLATVIPTENTPPVANGPWLGLALLNQPSDSRVDITGWLEFQQDLPKGFAGAAVLLSERMPFEFPTKVSDLFNELEHRGISRKLLFITLQLAVLNNPKDSPLYVIIGTPMRGIKGAENLQQHLSAWYIEPVVASVLKISLEQYSDSANLRDIGTEAEKAISEWSDAAEIKWCRVREARSEIVRRRDIGAAAEWFSGRTISLWGCGALGSTIAEILVRAGVRKLILRDSGDVAPGLLARQLFDDSDIGQLKTKALAVRLARINPNLEIELHEQDLLISPLDSNDWRENSDLVIDTTGSQSILEKLELRRTNLPAHSAIASLAIGHNAQHAMAVLARTAHSGGPVDVVRRAKLELATKGTGRAFLDEFWPEKARHKLFQPEPGCSEPTFVGSAADIGLLAGAMLNSIAKDMNEDSADHAETATAHFFAQPGVLPATAPSYLTFSWPPDHITADPEADYQIRISQSAWLEILAWISRNSRISGARIETGGVLFGERNDATRVIWVSEIIGPPPDSESSENGFVCGTEGTREVNDEKRKRTRKSVQYVGVWHTHPFTSPLPSATDIAGMGKILNAIDPPSKSLLMIIGGGHQRWTIGTYLFSRSDFGLGRSADVRICSLRSLKKTSSQRRLGIALSGGGSRAIAFHLGCLRALNDRGVLDQAEVISCVSGGSVIGAMYAYSTDPFETFDAKVMQVLRRGLLTGMIRNAFFSPLALGSLATALVSTSSAVAVDLLKKVLLVLAHVLPGNVQLRKKSIDKIRPPFRRWYSRTTALAETLKAELFGQAQLADVRRPDLAVILNACELRTGSAFRFGNKESGSWRFGLLVDNAIDVAKAVAASAAYPLLLPALDENLEFKDREGDPIEHRVFITDGGVYDNLGITCLEPGRSAEFSTNVSSVDYIISCDAGHGLFTDEVYPTWWVPRVARSFESTFRKVQTAAYDRLHRYVASGALKGFILPYLGQQDGTLPYIPPDLIRREQVYGYPTDFSAMDQRDIHAISLRGEQLTRLLIDRYCPEL